MHHLNKCMLKLQKRKLEEMQLIFQALLKQQKSQEAANHPAIPNLLLGFALAEATGLFGLVIALIILFAF